jgi:hypothetical protein
MAHAGLPAIDMVFGDDTFLESYKFPIFELMAWGRCI